MPVAAIEALVLLLSHSPPSTISETLSIISTSTAALKAAIPNPIALSAGTDLFQRYLISTLAPNPRGKGKNKSGGQAEDFKTIRTHLLSNGRLFVKRAKEARGKIAEVARRFVRDGSTVLTSGGSRVVAAVLDAACDAGVRFRVIYVRTAASRQTGDELAKNLRTKSVPVASISAEAVAYTMGQVDMVFVGAEGVVENGGVIGGMGTYQLGLLAKSAGKPFYVVAESHKFVRLYPLGQYDLPINQKVLDFKIEEEMDETGGKEEKEKDERENGGAEHDDAVDFTPPDLIAALVTESGVHTPSAVSEELIKIWY